MSTYTMTRIDRYEFVFEPELVGKPLPDYGHHSIEAYRRLVTTTETP